MPLMLKLTRTWTDRYALIVLSGLLPVVLGLFILAWQANRSLELIALHTSEEAVRQFDQMLDNAALPADVQCIQYLFNLIIPKLGFPLAENGKCDGQLVQCISQYQFRHLKYAHPDGVIDPTGRTFNSLIEEAVKVPVKAFPAMRIPSFLNVFGNNPGDAVQATVNPVKNEGYLSSKLPSIGT